MFQITLAEIKDRAERERRALTAAQGRLANEQFPSYASLTRVIEAAAASRVWGTLDYHADVRRSQGEHVNDTDEQVLAYLRERVIGQVFGFFGNRSTNPQSNEIEAAEHLAWIAVGRDTFSIGRGW